MKINIPIECGALVVVLMICGCVNSQGHASYGNSKNNSYSYNGYQVSAVPGAPKAVATTSRPQVVIMQGTESFTDPGATGTGFRQNYTQTILRDRERRINEYLRTCGMWGNTVQETRDKLKMSIGTADRQMAQLRNRIIVAGGNPDSNSNYLAVKEVRDNLAAKLQGLDNRIMNAIVSKATGDVARRLIWQDEDKNAANAAMENLQRAEEQQANENRKLLNQARW